VAVLPGDGAVEARHAKAADVEAAVRALEGDMWGYLFGETPAAPVATDGEKGIHAGGGKRSRTAVDDWLQLQEEREAQQQRRNKEKNARAERAAARAARLHGEVPAGAAGGAAADAADAPSVPDLDLDTAAAADAMDVDGSGGDADAPAAAADGEVEMTFDAPPASAAAAAAAAVPPACKGIPALTPKSRPPYVTQWGAIARDHLMVLSLR